MRTTTNQAWALTLAVILLGSMESREATAWQVSRDTIRLSERPEWGSGLRVVEELRVGELEGAPEYTFGAIDALAVRSDGGFYVYDRQAVTIREYDGRGRHVRLIGRRGAGPGEYAQVLGLAVSGSRLLVWDLGNARVTVFDSIGRYITSYRVTAGVWDLRGFTVDGAGQGYVKVARLGRRQSGEAGQWPRALVKFSARGIIVDTIPLPAFEDPETPLIIERPEGNRLPFQEVPFATVLRDGRVVRAWNRSYQLEILGGPVLVRRVPATALLREERAQWEAWTNYLRMEEAKRNIRHTFPMLPATKPYFRDLWVDDANRIWIDRYVTATKRNTTGKPGQPAYDWVEPVTFDLIDPAGRYLATLELPPVRPLAARGWQIWGIRRGELGEEYVVRLRIVSG
ncbi:MAG: 6-bladed beta-propeller [Longimicrobiales bacterium]